MPSIAMQYLAGVIAMQTGIPSEDIAAKLVADTISISFLSGGSMSFLLSAENADLITIQPVQVSLLFTTNTNADQRRQSTSSASEKTTLLVLNLSQASPMSMETMTELSCAVQIINCSKSSVLEAISSVIDRIYVDSESSSQTMPGTVHSSLGASLLSMLRDFSQKLEDKATFLKLAKAPAINFCKSQSMRINLEQLIYSYKEQGPASLDCEKVTAFSRLFMSNVSRVISEMVTLDSIHFSDFGRLLESYEDCSGLPHQTPLQRLALGVQRILRLFETHVCSLLYSYEILLADVHEMTQLIETTRTILSELVDGFVSSSLPQINELLARYTTVEARVAYYRELVCLFKYFQPLLDAPGDETQMWAAFKCLNANLVHLKDLQRFNTAEKSTFLYFVHFYLIYHLINCLWSTAHAKNPLETSFLFGVANVMQAVASELAGIKSIEKYMVLSFKVEDYQPPNSILDGDVLVDIGARLTALAGALTDLQILQEHIHLLCATVPPVPASLEKTINEVVKLVRTHELSDTGACTEDAQVQKSANCSHHYLQQLCHLFVHSFVPAGTPLLDLFPSNNAVATVLRGLTSIPSLLNTLEQYESIYKSVLDSLFSSANLHSFITRYGEHFSRFAIIASLQPGTKSYYNTLIVKFTAELTKSLSQSEQSMYLQLHTRGTDYDFDNSIFSEVVSYYKKALKTSDNSYLQTLQIDDLREAVQSLFVREQILPNLIDASLLLHMRKRLTFSIEFLGVLLTRACTNKVVSLSSISKVSSALAKSLNTFSSKYVKWTELWSELLLSSAYCPEFGLDAHYISQFLCEYTLTFGEEASRGTLESFSKAEPPAHNTDFFSFSRLPRTLNLLGVDSQGEYPGPSSGLLVVAPMATVFSAQELCSAFVVAGRLPSTAKILNSPILRKYGPLFETITGIFIPALRLFSRVINNLIMWMGTSSNSSKSFENQSLSLYMSDYVSSFYALLCKMSIFGELGPNCLHFHSLDDIRAGGTRTHVTPFYAALFSNSFLSLPIQLVYVTKDFSNTYGNSAGGEQGRDVCLENLPEKDTVDAYVQVLANQSRELYHAAAQLDAVFTLVSAEAAAIQDCVSEMVVAKPSMIIKHIGQLRYAISRLDANSPESFNLASQKQTHQGRLAAHYSIALSVARALTTKLIYALLILKEHILGEPDVLQYYQSDLAYTDYHQFRNTRYSTFSFIAERCRTITVPIDSHSATVRPRDACIMALAKFPGFLTLIEDIKAELIGYELPVDMLSVRLLAEVHPSILRANSVSRSALLDHKQAREMDTLTVEDFARVMLMMPVESLHGAELKLYHNMRMVMSLLGSVRTAAITSSRQLWDNITNIYSAEHMWTAKTLESYVASVDTGESPLQLLVDIMDHTDRSFQEFSAFLTAADAKSGFLRMVTLAVSDSFKTSAYRRYKVFRDSVRTKIGSAMFALTKYLSSLTSDLDISMRHQLKAGDVFQSLEHWSEMSAILKCLARATELDGLYNKYINLLIRLSKDIPLPLETKNAVDGLLNAAYPTFSKEYEVIKSTVTDKAASFNILANIRSMKEIFHESSRLNLEKVTDHALMFPDEVFARGEFGMDVFSSEVKGVRQRLVDLQKDLADLLDIATSASSVLNVHTSICTQDDKEALDMGVAVIDGIYLPFCSDVATLFKSLRDEGLNCSIINCDADSIDTTLSKFCRDIEGLVNGFLKLKGRAEESQAAVAWLGRNNSAWKEHSRITAFLLMHSQLVTELRPYIIQFCTPATFHSSQWPVLLAELRTVCGDNADFPAAQNLQARLQTYTVGEFVEHLLLFVNVFDQAAPATDQDRNLATTQTPCSQESLKALVTICESVLSQARARSSVYAMISSYTLLSKSIPLVLSYHTAIPIVKNCADITKSLDAALLSISDLTGTPFYLEFGPQLLALQGTFNMFLAAVKVLSDVQVDYLQLSSILSQNLSVVRRYIREAVLRYEAAITDLSTIYSHFSDVPSQTTTDNLVNFFSFMGGVEICTTRLSAIKETFQHTTKALSAFIEQQRYVSPRLFFLSDGDILSAISALSAIIGSQCGDQADETSNVVNNSTLAGSTESKLLEGHLRKIFPGFGHFIFAADTGKQMQNSLAASLTATLSKSGYSLVIGMRSLEGEVLHLERDQWFSIVDILHSAKNEVSIHPFLLKFEESMRLSIYAQIMRCYHVLRSSIDSSAPIDETQIPKLLEQSTCQAFIVGLQILVTKTLDLHIEGAQQKDLNRTGEFLQALLTHIQAAYKGMNALQCLLPEVIFLRSVVVTVSQDRSQASRQLDHFFRMRYYISKKSHSTPFLDTVPWRAIYEAPIVIKVLSREHVYSCNYVGASPRLVQTNLTSNHYTQSIIGISSQFFISPIGPAGTGKTESTRQLATHLGQPCFVFNCDEAFDYPSVVRIMLGALLIGCVVCFDEFNRLRSEDLSSISLIAGNIQKLLSLEDKFIRIYEAGNEKAIDTLRGELQRQTTAFLTQFVTNVQTPQLIRFSRIREFACFVTMNPTYKGRRTLPTNINALFRTVVMAQADIEEIVKILLFSLNFASSVTLSKLVCHFYRQLEATLMNLDPTQSHEKHGKTTPEGLSFTHDFGLRSIRTALHAGQLLLEENATLHTLMNAESSRLKEVIEKYVIVTVIRQSIAPTLVHYSLKAFEALLVSVFGSCEEEAKREMKSQASAQNWHLLAREQINQSEALNLLEGCSCQDLLQKFIIQATTQIGLLPTREFVTKVEHFHTCTCLNTGTILAGETATGKTAVQQVYYRARKALSAFLYTVTGVQQEPIVVYSMSPCALQAKSKLLGTMLESPREWIDSTLLKNVRSALANNTIDTSASLQTQLVSWPNVFFHLDCDIDPDWIEGFNTLLDDNRCLTLCTGERLSIPRNFCFIFESSTLRHATLATISRCSVSLHYSNVIGPADIIHSTIRRQLVLENQHVSRLLSLSSKSGSVTASVHPGRTRAGVGEKGKVLTNLRTQTYVLACVNIVAYDVFNLLLFADQTGHLTFNQFCHDYRTTDGKPASTQMATSVTAAAYKSRVLKHFTNTNANALSDGRCLIEAAIKDILSQAVVLPVSLSSVVSNLIKYAEQLCEKHSAMKFSVPQAVLTLTTMLRSTVVEAESYYSLNLSRIELGLVEAKIFLRNTETAQLLSPQFVSQVLSLSGISYNTLLLFYIRRFIACLAWSIGSQLPQAARIPFSLFMYKEYTEYFDIGINVSATAMDPLEAADADNGEDLEFNLLAINYLTIKPQSSEVFAGINIGRPLNTLGSQIGLQGYPVQDVFPGPSNSTAVPSALLLSSAAPLEADRHNTTGFHNEAQTHTAFNHATSLLAYVCSIDNEYWQLNDPENNDLQRSFTSKVHDSMSALMESSLNVSARRARFSDVVSSKRSSIGIRGYQGYNNTTNATTEGSSIVPNIDTQMYVTYLNHIIGQGKNVLLVGPPGSGKTMLLTHVLQHMPNLRVAFMSFSSQTSPADLIAILFRHFDIVEKDNHYELVASSEQTLCLIIDEVNLVDKDVFDAQPAIEFLRVLLEYRYFIYDGPVPKCKGQTNQQGSDAKNAPTEISAIVTLQSNVLIACSCNPPTDAGRSLLSERFTRHLALLYLDTPSHEALVSIYSAYVEDMFTALSTETSCFDSLSPDAAHMLSVVLANAMITTYEQVIALTDKNQRFYVYSPRDLTRWVEAVRHHCQSYVSGTEDEQFSYYRFVQLVLFEGVAVFVTKLVTEQEKSQITACIVNSLGTFMKALSDTIPDAALSTHELAPVIFNTLSLQKGFKMGILSNLPPVELSACSRVVLTDEQAWSNLSLLFRKRFAQTTSGLTFGHINLLGSTLYHIVRTLNTSPGHLIVSAQPGLLTTPLLQFVAWLSGSRLVELRSTRRYSLKDFQAFLRDTIEAAVTKPENVLLVISYECGLTINFLEYLNNLLCSGDIPGLFSNDHLHKLLTTAGLSEMAQLRQLVKQKLHILFTVSCIQEESMVVISPALYNRCQLINIADVTVYSLVLEAAEHMHALEFSERAEPLDSTNLMLEMGDLKYDQKDQQDWMSEGTKQLLEILKEQRDDDVSEIQDTLSIAAPGFGAQQRLCSALALLHERVPEVIQRHQSVTGMLSLPGLLCRSEYMRTVTLSSILHYKRLCKSFASSYKKAYAEFCSQQDHLSKGLRVLDVIQNRVTELQDELRLKRLELAEMARITEEKLAEITKVREVAMTSKAESVKLSIEINQKHEYIQARMGSVQAELAEVEPTLAAARGSVRTISKTALEEIRRMARPAEAITLVMGAVVIIISTNVAEINTTWEAVRKIMQRGNFQSSILAYNPIEDEHAAYKLERLTEYQDNPSFKRDTVHHASQPAGLLFDWVISTYSILKIKSKIQPLEQVMLQIKEEASALEIKRADVVTQLMEFEKTIDNLTAECSEYESQQIKLQAQTDECEANTKQASVITELLGNEIGRWKQQHADAAERQTSLPGDVLLELFYQTYVGCYTDSLRTDFVIFAEEMLDNLAIKYSKDKTPFFNGPMSNYSLIDRARCPTTPILLFDYTRSDLDCLQTTYKKHILVSSLTTDLMASVERALKFGFTLIIEDGDALDPALFVLHQVVEQANPMTQNSRDMPDKVYSVEIAGSVISVHPDFCAIILCQTIAKAIHFATKCTMINFAQSEERSHEIIADHIISTLQPELHTARTKIESELAAHATTIVSLERELLHALSTVDQDTILKNSALVSHLQATKSRYMQIQAQREILQRQTKDYDSMKTDLQGPVQVLTQLFFVMRRLRTMETGFIFTLEQLLYILSMALAAYRRLPEKNYSDLIVIFACLCYNNVQSSLTTTARDAFRRYLEELIEPEAKAALTHKQLAFSALTTFADHCAFYRPYSNCILLNVVGDIDPQTIVQSILQRDGTGHPQRTVLHSLPFGSPEARISRVAGVLKSVQQHDVVLLTNIHLAPASYCEDLCRVLQEYLKMHPHGALIIVSLQGAPSNGLSEEIHSLATSIGCTSILSHGNLNPVALFAQTKADVKKIALEKMQNRVTVDAEVTETTTKQIESAAIDQQLSTLLDKIAYIYVAFRVRAELRPYGFVGLYSFTTIDLRYAVEIIISELEGHAGNTAVQRSNTFVRHFTERIVQSICFGNQISMPHDKFVAETFVRHILELETLPPMLETCEGAFLHSGLNEIMRATRHRDIEELSQVIRGHSTYDAVKGSQVKRLTPMSTTVVGAIVSKLLALRKMLVGKEDDGLAVQCTGAWSVFAAAISKVGYSTKNALISYLHAAENGPAALDTLQNTTGKDALGHITSLIECFDYCKSLLLSLQKSGHIAEFLPASLGADAHMCFTTLSQNLLNQASDLHGEREHCIAFTTMPTGGSVAILVKSFLCSIDNGTVRSAPSSGFATIYLTVRAAEDRSDTAIKYSVAPVFLNDTRTQLLGYLEGAEGASVLLQACAFYLV